VTKLNRRDFTKKASLAGIVLVAASGCGKSPETGEPRKLTLTEPKPDPPKFEEFTLDNGLNVILRPVQAKDVAVVVLYSTGADHDPKGRSGLAHFVEHLQCTAAAGEFPTQVLNRRLPSSPAACPASQNTPVATWITTTTPRSLAPCESRWQPGT